MFEIQPNSKKRNRQRSIAISDNLWQEIKDTTQGYMSASGFIRMAIKKRWNKFANGDISYKSLIHSHHCKVARYNSSAKNGSVIV